MQPTAGIVRYRFPYRIRLPENFQYRRPPRRQSLSPPVACFFTICVPVTHRRGRGNAKLWQRKNPVLLIRHQFINGV
ncbi:hypothetical protein KCP73_11210 [Salmonella enterica subsp. enterica]|nr:hypothetical protein KCP73_11210 [Salmonella enterica subsp. enterica]